MRAPPRLLGRSIAKLVERDLRRSFRRVLWIRDGQESLGDGPLVVLANHHHFHDGYLLWLLVRRGLGREAMTWMRDWNRAPIFAALGALPFPMDDPDRRRVTLLRTARRMAEQPRTALVYFPEGRQGLAQSGLASFPQDRMSDLARILPPETRWLPVAIRIAWWAEARPVALIRSGKAFDAPDGTEHDRLQHLMDLLADVGPNTAGMVRLLEGRRPASERWNLAALAPLFRRWT